MASKTVAQDLLRRRHFEQRCERLGPRVPLAPKGQNLACTFVLTHPSTTSDKTWPGGLCHWKLQIQHRLGWCHQLPVKEAAYVTQHFAQPRCAITTMVEHPAKVSGFRDTLTSVLGYLRILCMASRNWSSTWNFESKGIVSVAAWDWS